MPAYQWGPSKDVVALHRRFDPPQGSVSIDALLALLSDGKHIRDHFSDLYIGMVVYAVKGKISGWNKLHGCLLTLPLSEDMRLRTAPHVVQFGQPFLLPDGRVWSDSGYDFRGSDKTTLLSPLSFEEIKAHDDFEAWYDFVFNSVFPAGSSRAPPAVFKYSLKGLVQPRVNFNNVVAYHDSHGNSSCTDGLCKDALDFDAVSNAFADKSRAKCKVTSSFWTQTTTHTRKTSDSSTTSTPRSAKSSILPQHIGRKDSRKKDDRFRRFSLSRACPFANRDLGVPPVKTPYQRLPPFILDVMDKYDCVCGNQEPPLESNGTPLGRNALQCDFCGHWEHEYCAFKQASFTYKKGDAYYACTGCRDSEHVPEYLKRANAKANALEKGAAVMTAVEDKSVKASTKASKRKGKAKQAPGEDQPQCDGSGDLEGPASEFGDTDEVDHSQCDEEQLVVESP